MKRKDGTWTTPSKEIEITVSAEPESKVRALTALTDKAKPAEVWEQWVSMLFPGEAAQVLKDEGGADPFGWLRHVVMTQMTQSFGDWLLEVVEPLELNPRAPGAQALQVEAERRAALLQDLLSATMAKCRQHAGIKPPGAE